MRVSCLTKAQDNDSSTDTQGEPGLSQIAGKGIMRVHRQPPVSHGPLLSLPLSRLYWDTARQWVNMHGGRKRLGNRRWRGRGKRQPGKRQPGKGQRRR